MVLQQIGEERIIHKGRIFEVINKDMKKGDKTIKFELVKRSPGVRLIIIKNNKILLTKEYRYELKDYDYRLPGGKVFDTLDQYNQGLKENDILEHAKQAAETECIEETGLIPKNIKHIHTSHSGATVIWDLFYFLIDDFETHSQGQNLQIGEIIHPEWIDINKVKQMCINKEIKEDRSVAVLLRYLLTNN